MSDLNFEGIPDETTTQTKPSATPNLSGIPDAPAGPSLRENLDAASQVDPAHATKVLKLAPQLGASPEAVSSDIKSAEAAAKRPSDAFLADVSQNLPKLAALAGGPDAAKIHDDLPNLAITEHVAQNFTYAKGYLDTMKAAVEGSVFGHIYDRGAPDIGLGPNSTFGETLTHAAIQTAMDFPFMVIGGAGAGAAGLATMGPPGVLAAGPGAFALPAFLKTSIAQYYKTGNIDSVHEALERSWQVAKETGKQGIVGFMTELTGGAVNKATVGAFLPTAEQAATMTFKQLAAKMAAENVAMTAAGGAVEGRMPTFRDLSTNAILAAGLEGVHFAGRSVFEKPQADAARNYVESLDKVAQESEFRKRDPEGYAAHMNDVASGPVRIPIEAFEKAFPGGVKDAYQLGVEDSYYEAKRTRGDVELPLGTFMSEALDKQRAGLSNDVKFDSDAKTGNQIKAQEEEQAKTAAAGKPAESPAPASPVESFVQRLRGMLGLGDAAAKEGPKAVEPSPQAERPAPPAPAVPSPDQSPVLSFPPSIAEHPTLVKAQEEARPFIGDDVNDRAKIVEHYRESNKALHDVKNEATAFQLKEMKGTAQPGEREAISDKLSKLAMKAAAIDRLGRIAFNDPEKAVGHFAKIDAGQESDAHLEDPYWSPLSVQQMHALPSDPAAAQRIIEGHKELAAARIEMGQGSTDMTGVDPKIAEKHAKMEAAAQKEAESILMKPIHDELRAEAIAKFEKRKAEITERAKADVADLPVFRAGDDLREAFGAGREPADIANKFLESNDLPESERIRFEAIAELNGFSSGDEMANKIVDAWRSDERENLIKSIVESDLAELRPMKDPVKLRLQAIEAIHSEKSTDLLALKAEILNGMHLGDKQDDAYRAGIEDRAKAAAEEAKQFAREAIAGKAVKDAGAFRPYYTAERDAALRAYKASKAGDYEAAAKATGEQLQAHALAAESLRAKDKIERWTKALTKQMRADKSSFKADEHFVQAADILRRFGFERGDFNQADKVEPLKDWAARMQVKTGAVAIPAWLMDESVAKSYRDLSLNQLHDVRDSVANIKRVGNAENEMRVIRSGEQLDALVDEMLASKEANTRGGKTRRDGDPESNFDKLVAKKDALRNGLVSVPSLLSKLDGFKDGVFTDALVKTREVQRSKELGDIQDFNAKWRELHAPYSDKELKANDTEPVFIPELKSSKTKSQILTLAAYQGTADGKAKVQADLGISQDSIDALLNRVLDKRDRDFVQAKLDLIGSYKSKIAELYLRKTGFEPEWVAPEPIKSKHGDYKGGYYPLIPDAMVSNRPIVDLEGDKALTDPYPTWKAATRNGYTEARNQYARYPVSLNADGAVRHMTDVIHDLAFNEWTVDANKILTHKDVSAALIDALGKDGKDQVNAWVKEIAGNDVKPTRDLVEKMAANLRERTTIAMLGSNIAVALSQFHGLSLAAVIEPEFGITHVGSGMVDGFRKLALHPSEFADMVHFAHESSPFMRAASEKVESSIAAMNREMMGRDGAIKSATESISGGFFQAVHYLTSIPVWTQAYKVGLESKGFNHDQAVEYADHIIRESTVTGDKADLPAIMKNSEIGKLVTQFGGFFNKQVQAMYKAQGRLRNAAADGEGMAATPQFLGHVAAISIVPGLIYALTHYGLPSDDKDSKAKWEKALIRTFSPVTMIPVANTVQDMVIDKIVGTRGRPSAAPATGIFDSMERAIGAVGSKRVRTEAKLESMARVASVAGPMPYPQKFNDLLFNAYDIANGMNFRMSDLVKRRPMAQRHR